MCLLFFGVGGGVVFVTYSQTHSQTLESVLAATVQTATLDPSCFAIHFDYTDWEIHVLSQPPNPYHNLMVDYSDFLSGFSLWGFNKPLGLYFLLSWKHSLSRSDVFKLETALSGMILLFRLSLGARNFLYNSVSKFLL